MEITNETISRMLLDEAASSRNTLKLEAKPAFGTPIFAFGAGDDPLFAFYKRDIGEFLLTPDEWLAKKYGRSFDPAEITVFSWAFPQTEETRASNRAETKLPSRDWALNRTFGEEFNRETARIIETKLCEAGVEAVAPMANEAFSWEHSEKYGYASNWSERHAAYICGLGTFGLCDGLISKLGKAVRYGSVIIAKRLSVTSRDYERYNEYCIADHGCTACMRRCPAGAITRDGHDKDKCVAYQRENVLKNAPERFGWDGSFGCGLCQTGTPCEHSAPGRKHGAETEPENGSAVR